MAVMPEGVSRPYEALHGLRCVPLAEEWARRQLRLVSRPPAMLPSAARLLREHLLEG